MRAPGAVRLLGGELRGRPVRVPPGARPSEGRVREALFSIWAERIPGARFLDLFAGSGAVALEALSRGAATAVAIDGAGPAIAAVRDNARALGLASRCQVVRADLGHEVDRLAQRMGRFDLVFADPPYGFAEWAELLRLAERLLDGAGALALEHSRRADLPCGDGSLTMRDRRNYGESCLSFYGPAAGDATEVRGPA